MYLTGLYLRSVDRISMYPIDVYPIGAYPISVCHLYKFQEDTSSRRASSRHVSSRRASYAGTLWAYLPYGRACILWACTSRAEIATLNTPSPAPTPAYHLCWVACGGVLWWAPNGSFSTRRFTRPLRSAMFFRTIGCSPLPLEYLGDFVTNADRFHKEKSGLCFVLYELNRIAYVA
jgi:hypothetical protein